MGSIASTPTAGRSLPLDPAGFSSEFALLLACCAVGDHETSSRSAAACLAAGVDWQQVIRLAEHHSVLPLLYQALCGLSAAVPPDILGDLRQRYQHNARRNLAFTSELFRVLSCLEAHHVPAIPYKGPVLAEAVYGDLALRSFSDLDILVRPADVGSAKAALETLGYTLSSPLSEAEERAYLATGYEYTFDGPAGRNLLEIQWRILPRFYAIHLDCCELFDRAASATVGGRMVRTLSSEDLLLTLCVHAAKHAWIRLCWLRDIAGVVQYKLLDWTLVGERSRDLGIQRILAIGLLLAHRLLGAPVPDWLRESWQGNRQIDSLYNQVAQHLPGAEEYSAESRAYFRLMLRLRERWSDRVRFAFRLTFTPGIGEWQVLRLPAPLFPLYRVIRLFRLGGRLLSGRSSA